MHSAHVPVISCRFIIVVRLFCSLLDFSVHLLYDFVSFNYFAFHLFIVRCSKDSDPGLYSSFLDPVVREVPVQVPSSSMQVDKHHTSDCTDFVLI